ncbi:MAG TPA: hypothetical protein VIL35_16735 [Vicinamibacterales bacterium]
MAKKTTAKASKTTARAPRVSLKKIAADIDKALARLEGPKARAAAGDPNKVDQARLSLRAARHAVESACVPGFEFPF